MLFEIVCDLLLTLEPRSYSVRGGDDWSHFERRFHLNGDFPISEMGIKKISEALKEGLALNPLQLAAWLADHLEARFESFMEIVKTYLTSDPIAFDGALSAAKLWINKESEAYDCGDPGFKKAADEFTIGQLEDIRRSAESMRKTEDKLAVFAKFAELETVFEPIERCILDVMAAIDYQLELNVSASLDK